MTAVIYRGKLELCVLCLIHLRESIETCVLLLVPAIQ